MDFSFLTGLIESNLFYTPLQSKLLKSNTAIVHIFFHSLLLVRGPFLIRTPDEINNSIGFDVQKKTDATRTECGPERHRYRGTAVC